MKRKESGLTERSRWALPLALLVCSACSSMRASIDIHAPPERVWAIVADVDHYQDWNPFFTKGQGCAVPGSTLALTMNPVGRSPASFSPKVLKVAPGQALVWRGRLLLPGVFDGTHALVVERLDSEHTRFTQQEDFGGILVPFVPFEPYHKGWLRMNAALKARAEAAPSSRPSASSDTTR